MDQFHAREIAGAMGLPSQKQAPGMHICAGTPAYVYAHVYAYASARVSTHVDAHVCTGRGFPHTKPGFVPTKELHESLLVFTGTC